MKTYVIFIFRTSRSQYLFWYNTTHVHTCYRGIIFPLQHTGIYLVYNTQQKLCIQLEKPECLTIGNKGEQYLNLCASQFLYYCWAWTEQYSVTWRCTKLHNIIVLHKVYTYISYLYNEMILHNFLQLIIPQIIRSRTIAFNRSNGVVTSCQQLFDAYSSWAIFATYSLRLYENNSG